MKTLVALLTVILLSTGSAFAQDRMPPIPMDKMTDAQKKAVAEYKAIRNTDLVGPPWTVLLRVPDLVVPSLQLRLHNHQNSALTPKLTEFAILIAARHWTNSYEWNAHYTLGEKAGLSTDIMAAVADGRRPERMAEDEARSSTTSAWSSCTTKSVSDATYERTWPSSASQVSSRPQGFRVTTRYLAMVMNVARSPSPANATQKLTSFPR